MYFKLTKNESQCMHDVTVVTLVAGYQQHKGQLKHGQEKYAVTVSQLQN